MRRPGIYSTLAFASTLFLGLACSSRTGTEVEVGDDSPSTNAVSCSVSPDKNAVISGGAISATVNAAGGTAPYSVNGVSGTFSSSTVISRNPSITTTYPQLVEETITVKDSLNSSATCKLSVVVFPTGSTNVGDFSCALIPSNTSPKVNETIYFTPYVFDANQPDSLTYYATLQTGGGQPNHYTNNALKRSERQQLGATYYNVLFDGAGNPQARTANLTVQQNGRVAVCSVPITVRENPSVMLSSSASTVGLTDTITVTATPRSFLSTAITYNFTTNDAGVTITQSGNTAQVRVNDGKFHSPRITVTANAGGETATAYSDINFKLLNFSCSVQGPASTANLMINQDISIAATSSAGNLEAYNIQQGYYGNLQSGNSTPIRIQYSVGGTKTVSFSLKDVASGTPCNNGAAYSVTFTVREPLRCDMALLPGSSNTGDVVSINGRVATNTGSSAANIRIHSITATPAAGFEIRTSPENAAWTAQFNSAGAYDVRVTLKDLANPGVYAECPAFTHTATFVEPSCSVTFVDPTINTPDPLKPIVIAARAHNPLRLRIYATNSTVTNVNYGAPVQTGATSAWFRYTQNHTSRITATVTVRNAGNGAERNCSAIIDVGPALACTLSRSVATTMVTNRWFRLGSRSEVSNAGSPYPVNPSLYNEGGGFASAFVTTTMRAHNELIYPGYEIDYRLDSANGAGVRQIVSPASQVNFVPGYNVNGVYPSNAQIYDPFDSAASGVGNSCALRDADRRYAHNRLVVNTAQIVKFQRRSDTHAITECKLLVRNRGNRPNNLQSFNAFYGDGMTLAASTLAVPVHSGAESLDALPFFNMPVSGTMCGLSVKALGNHMRLEQVGNTEMPDGQNPFELYVKVTFRRYSTYYTAYYQLHHL